tara:strand:+ start:26512 stop:26706 length:195 start_codon:yes stop_codon:yes gene_type:complete
MRSKISKKILSETSQETKDKVNEYANKLVLSGVGKSFYCYYDHPSYTKCKKQCKNCKEGKQCYP